MVSSVLSAMRSMYNDTSNTPPRISYYLRHPGLMPESTLNKPLSDNNGLDIQEKPGSDELGINAIDLNIFRNGKKHYCDQYDITERKDPQNKEQIPQLVTRRGFSFEVTLRLSRPYKKGTDKVSIQMAFGKRPKIPKKTLVRLPLEGLGTTKEWKINLKAMNANELIVELTSPANCFVGIWRLSGLVTYNSYKTYVTKYKEVYIIFNPFNKEDDVYMSDPKERDEYVMNEHGLVFQGTCDTYKQTPWAFSQFYGQVLNCSLYLLEKSDLSVTDCGKPVLVCRRLAAMVNSADDDGVLEGKWDGDYKKGTPPMDWLGSAKILEQYYKTKKTVKYGQCWVFSGVLCTVCRAIGIPCRSITNYCSAHDTDSSVSVDHFYNEKKEYEEFMNEDSIWNFHVWNEVYMTRPDLPNEEYGGWQALDSTPQETSDGFFTCGPCPIAAIKKGDTTASYDAPFIIAEVNADLIMWLKDKNGKYRYANIATNEIGKRLFTKKVNEMQFENITLEYKYPEGSTEERASLNLSMMNGSRGNEVKLSGPEDVESELIVNKDSPLGADFTMKLKIQNTGNKTRTLHGMVSVITTYYTGVAAHTLFKESVSTSLKPKAKTSVSAVIRYWDYQTKLLDHCNMAVRCVIEVEETQQIIHQSKAFRLKKPDLIFEAPSYVKRGQSARISVSFKNPLPTYLTRCILYVDGSGLTYYHTMVLRNVAATAKFDKSFYIKPYANGYHILSCNFSCDQISGIVGQHSIEVGRT